MRQCLFLLLFISALTGYSQTQVSGKVINQNFEPISDANVYLKNSYDGTTTDSIGNFHFETSLKDSLVLIVSAMGYEQLEKPLIDKTQDLFCQLNPVNDLNVVLITAGQMEISNKNKSVVMKPLDVLTTSGALANITNALSTLPGTANVGNDGRLFVRGGDATETGIYFDGLRVANAYGTTTSGLPTRNRFDPKLFKGMFFSTGGYSAEYGNALSSVLALQTIDRPIRNQTDIALMSVGDSVGTSVVGKKQSISGELAYTDLQPYQSLIKQNFDFERAPQNFQGRALYRHDLGKDGLLKSFVQLSQFSICLMATSTR